METASGTLMGIDSKHRYASSLEIRKLATPISTVEYSIEMGIFSTYSWISGVHGIHQSLGLKVQAPVTKIVAIHANPSFIFDN